MKSYSSHTVPPEPLGMSDGVPTSKTLHPQAQAQLILGIRYDLKNNRHHQIVQSNAMCEMA